MVVYAGSHTYTAYVDMTLTRSKIKVKVTGLLNFRQLAKPCMLAAMTAAPLWGFLVLHNWFSAFIIVASSHCFALTLVLIMSSFQICSMNYNSPVSLSWARNVWSVPYHVTVASPSTEICGHLNVVKYRHSVKFEL